LYETVLKLVKSIIFQDFVLVRSYRVHVVQYNYVERPSETREDKVLSIYLLLDYTQSF